MGNQTVLVDARGLRCPWPVLRLARALREGATSIELLSDDPAASREVTAFAVGLGLPFLVTTDGFRIG